ncbi:hypothetical protein [Sphingomonas montanisoli]|uniref:Glycosyltransferase RgtA/B/C/D-like domain-containing protein n=1 Tax=Sphingomonas montanisoli TaxID=2606412 RepID=A0A5D9CCU9_9SPHN|nr:hypothetical protein [Sphingomonas montanisoli]TZG28972.1 hypothetical protein FYJ91_02175 [Sphingomonas montanisoli]
MGDIGAGGRVSEDRTSAAKKGRDLFDRLPESSVSYALIAFASIAVISSFAMAYPGVMTEDSFNQYKEAVSGQYKDWFPPIMARLWSIFLVFTPVGSAFFVLHMACYWGGLYLIADRLRDMGHRGMAFATLAIGIVPSQWVTSLFIWKDVGMAVTALAAFAILFRARSKGRSMPKWQGVIVATLLAYSVMVRANGPFAAIPVIFYAFHAPIARRPILTATLGLVAIVFAVGIATPINRHVFAAKDAGGRFALLIYDMVGTAHFARDTAVFDKMGGASLAAVDRCYTPQLGDGIAHSKCQDEVGTRSPGAVGVAKFVLRHPLAYAQHRLLHWCRGGVGTIITRSIISPIRCGLARNICCCSGTGF